jgi:hypothetical protein
LNHLFFEPAIIYGKVCAKEKETTRASTAATERGKARS